MAKFLKLIGISAVILAICCILFFWPPQTASAYVYNHGTHPQILQNTLLQNWVVGLPNDFNCPTITYTISTPYTRINNLEHALYFSSPYPFIYTFSADLNASKIYITLQQQGNVIKGWETPITAPTRITITAYYTVSTQEMYLLLQTGSVRDAVLIGNWAGEAPTSIAYTISENGQAVYGSAFTTAQSSISLSTSYRQKQEVFTYVNSNAAEAYWRGQNSGISWDFLVKAFAAVDTFFEIEFLPNLKLWYLIAIPVVFGIILLFFKIIKH